MLHAIDVTAATGFWHTRAPLRAFSGALAIGKF
jgi:hypothetical protein